ncbi:MAG: Hsp20/alpha crystallin family protein [Flavobacteriales bacterium]|nr:Hsp20/alpha crystallin family protein [Flavobacteriales bacterium]
MKLAKLNPFVPSKDSFFPFSSNPFDKFFDDSAFDQMETMFKPATNILETDKAFEIQLAIPGLKKEDIKIDLRENTLTISGERNTKKDQKEGSWHYSEISQGKFSRTFTIPDFIIQDKIEANLTEGILELILPKAEPKQAKTISIK